MRDLLGDDRVPALLVDGDALLEAAKEEVPLVEVAEEELVDLVLFLEGGGAMVVVLEVEIAGVDLEVGVASVEVVLLPDELHVG